MIKQYFKQMVQRLILVCFISLTKKPTYSITAEFKHFS